MRWFHEYVLWHTIRVNRVTVPAWDRSGSKGILYTCSCKKTWVK